MFNAILCWSKSKTVVVAPFNAIVTLKMTEAGSFAAPGVPLFQLTDISSLRFTINVPEGDLNLFHDQPSVAKIHCGCISIHFYFQENIH
jgi:multidrug resistance efflux pump